MTYILLTGRTRSHVVSTEEGKRLHASLSTGGLRCPHRQPRRSRPPRFIPSVGPEADYKEGPRTKSLPFRFASAAGEGS